MFEWLDHKVKYVTLKTLPGNVCRLKREMTYLEVIDLVEGHSVVFNDSMYDSFELYTESIHHLIGERLYIVSTRPINGDSRTVRESLVFVPASDIKQVKSIMTRVIHSDYVVCGYFKEM